MKTKNTILGILFCFSCFIYAQQTEGSGVVSYPDNNVKVVGEKIFWSANPVTDESIESDLLTIFYKGLYNRRNNYLSGIKGTIDKPGGYIKIQVYPYDSKNPKGLQLVKFANDSYEFRPVYSVEITKSSPNVFSKTTKEQYYEYWDYGLHIGKISSDDIKTLGSRSLSGAFIVNCGSWPWTWLRAFSIVKSSCALEIDKDALLNLENQPVVVKIMVKDATLIDVRVPVVANNENLKTIIQKEYPYYIIKKVNVEVLEAPEDNNTSSYYEDMISKSFEWANKIYTVKTGKTLSNDAVIAGAKVGNPRVLFKNIDITIRKASQKSYSRDKLENVLKDGEINIADFRKGEITIKFVSKIADYDQSGYVPALSFIWPDDKDRPEKNFMILSYADINAVSQEQMKLVIPHEAGHYFGLEHTFEDGCSEPNDRISDTPPADGVNMEYVNCVAPIQCGGHRRLIENIMDYGNCQFMFTPGQVRVIRNTITKKYLDLYTVQMSTDATINTSLNIMMRDLRPKKTDRVKREAEDQAMPQDFILYPVPAKDVLNITNITTNTNEEYVIYDLNGWIRMFGRTGGQIDVSSLSKGLYIIRIKNSNKQFIKE